MKRECIRCKSRNIESQECLMRGIESFVNARQYYCEDCGAEWYGVQGAGIKIVEEGNGDLYQDIENCLTNEPYYDSIPLWID